MFKIKSVVIICYFSCVFHIDAHREKAYVCPSNVVNIDDGSSIDNLADHCKNTGKVCLAKCCKRGEILIEKKTAPDAVDVTCRDPLPYDIKVDRALYDRLEIYKPFNEQDQKQKSDMHFYDKDKFHLVQNKMFENKACGSMYNKMLCQVLENGTVAFDTREFGGPLTKYGPAHYCTDLLYSEETKNIKMVVLVANEKDEKAEQSVLDTYKSVASLITAFFLVLVFLVYCLLPQLRGLSGMLLMSYVAALFLLFTMQAFMILLPPYYENACLYIGPLFYYGYLSSFFWLNIMSFDIWWTFRAQRYHRATNRKGIMAKYRWYSLYGWGVPAAITVIALIIDLKRNELPHVITLRFLMCLNADNNPMLYYFIIPSGIITIANITLFTMTVYNIWLIKREIHKICASGGNTNKNKNRFRTYLKLSLLMGITWMLEFIPKLYEEVGTAVWLGILVSFCNFMIGVVIFIMFILNKKTLKMLCVRFNINWPFSGELNLNPSSRSTATKSSTNTNNGSYHHTKSTVDSDTDVNDTEVSSCPKNENTNV